MVGDNNSINKNNKGIIKSKDSNTPTGQRGLRIRNALSQNQDSEVLQKSAASTARSQRGSTSLTWETCFGALATNNLSQAAPSLLRPWLRTTLSHQSDAFWCCAQRHRLIWFGRNTFVSMQVRALGSMQSHRGQSWRTGCISGRIRGRVAPETSRKQNIYF